MIAVNDFSHLDPREAHRKVVQLAHRIYAEQFHSQFFVKDPRPELYLKYEIRAFLEGTIQEFHGWTDPIGQALDFVYDRLTSWFWSFWYNTIRPGIDAIVSGFRWLWDSAVSWARSAYNKALDVYYKVMEVYSYVRYTVYSTIQSIWSTLQGIGSTIYSKAREAINVVWSWLIQLWYNYIQPGVQAIVGGFKWIWDNTLSFAQSAVTWAQNAYNAINQAWNSIVEKVSGAFEALSKQMAALPQAIGSAFQSAISYIYDTFKRIWDDILAPFGEALMDKIRGILDTIGSVLWQFFSGFYNTILSLGPINPLTAKDNVPMIMKLALEGVIGLGGAYIIGELLHPLKEIGLGHVAAMIYEASNYDIITGAVIGALATAAFGQPLKYAFNEMFRPYLLSWSDVMELHSRAFLTDEELLTFMKFYGYPDEFKRYFDELANTPLRYFALSAIARIGYFDEDFFREELNRSGYSQRAKEVMLQMYQQTANEAAKGYYGNVVISRYREGIIDRDGLNEELKMLGYPESLRKQLITGAELYYDLDTVKDYVNAIRQAYRYGKITLDELRAELASLGIRSDKIERIVAIEQARAKEDVGTTQEEEVRAYGRGTAIKRFREGLITESELEQELRLMGYSSQWIERLKLVARLERDYDFAMSVLSAAKTAYKKKRIDDTRFIEILRSFGFTDEKIELELSLLKLELGLGLEEEEVAG